MKQETQCAKASVLLMSKQLLVHTHLIPLISKKANKVKYKNNNMTGGR